MNKELQAKLAELINNPDYIVLWGKDSLRVTQAYEYIPILMSHLPELGTEYRDWVMEVNTYPIILNLKSRSINSFTVAKIIEPW